VKNEEIPAIAPTRSLWRIPSLGRDGGSIFWVLGDGGYYFKPNPNPKQKSLFTLSG